MELTLFLEQLVGLQECMSGKLLSIVLSITIGLKLELLKNNSKVPVHILKLWPMPLMLNNMDNSKTR